MSTATKRLHPPLLAALVLPAAVVALAAAVYIHFSIQQWRELRVPSWDLAIFSEAVKAYAHAQAPIVPIKGPGFNLLGDHFHPLLIILAPFWRAFPSPLTLLVAQDLMIAASAWPIARLAVRRLGVLVGTALALAYALSWGLQSAVAAQFHEIALAVPLLAWAGAAFVERRWLACVAWLAPLVLVKEDLGLTVLVAGLAVAWRGRGDVAVRTRRWSLSTPQLGLVLAAWGTLWFLVTVLVLLPMLSPSGTWQYGLGGNAGDGSTPTNVSGGLVARLFTPTVKLETLGLLVASAGVVGLASPWMALVLPTLAWRFLASKEAYWGWEYWHYNAVLMPIIVVALLDVLIRWRQAREQVGVAGESLVGVSADGAGAAEASVGESGAVGSAGLVGAGAGAPGSASLTRTVTSWRSLCGAVGIVIALATSLLLAGHMQVTGTDPYPAATPARQAAAQTVMAHVPDGASVQTDLTLLAYLVPKADVTWVGSEQSEAPDYVLIDSASGAWGGGAPADAAVWARERTGVSYRLVLRQGDFQLAERAGD